MDEQFPTGTYRPQEFNDGKPTPVPQDSQPGSNVTPTGPQYSQVTGQQSGKVVGSDGKDRVSISDLRADKDQIIHTGAGDDIFNFNGAESRSAQNVGKVNGIVDFGDGNDTVFLGYRIEDYKFTLRSDGGIKIQYIGQADAELDGVAVTFRNAERFTFRNADSGTNPDGPVGDSPAAQTTYDVDELRYFLTHDGASMPPI